jgi:hypothetical protein
MVRRAVPALLVASSVLCSEDSCTVQATAGCGDRVIVTHFTVAWVSNILLVLRQHLSTCVSHRSQSSQHGARTCEVCLLRARGGRAARGAAPSSSPRACMRSFWPLFAPLWSFAPLWCRVSAVPHSRSHSRAARVHLRGAGLDGGEAQALRGQHHGRPLQRPPAAHGPGLRVLRIPGCVRVFGLRRALAEAAARCAAALAYRVIPFGTHFQHKVSAYRRSLARGPSLSLAAQIVHFALQTVAIGCAVGACGALACSSHGARPLTHRSRACSRNHAGANHTA